MGSKSKDIRERIIEHPILLEFNDRYVETKQVLLALKVSIRTLYRYRKANKLEWFRLGNKIKYDILSVVALTDNKR